MDYTPASTDEIANNQFYRPYIYSQLFVRFKLSCDTNGEQYGAYHWLLQFFVKCLAAEALNAGITLKSKLNKRQIQNTLVSYYEVVKY